MIVDDKGTQFLEFRPMSESEIDRFAPEFSVTLIKHDEQFLFVFDRWKNHWEFPGGSIEPGETVRECAIRELWEESGQKAQRLAFNGGILIKTAEDVSVWGAIFSGVLDHVQPFAPNDEIAEIIFWDQDSPVEINSIDQVLINYFSIDTD